MALTSGARVVEAVEPRKTMCWANDHSREPEERQPNPAGPYRLQKSGRIGKAGERSGRPAWYHRARQTPSKSRPQRLAPQRPRPPIPTRAVRTKAAVPSNHQHPERKLIKPLSNVMADQRLQAGIDRSPSQEIVSGVPALSSAARKPVHPGRRRPPARPAQGHRNCRSMRFTAGSRKCIHPRRTPERAAPVPARPPARIRR